jgi:hypothetical protein
MKNRFVKIRQTHCNQKERGVRTNRTPWPNTLATHWSFSDAQTAKVPKLIRGPWSSISLRLCTELKLCVDMDPQTYTVFIPETFVALIRKLKSCISFARCTEANRLRFLADLPLIRQHIEFDPFRPGTYGTQTFNITTDRSPQHNATNTSNHTPPDSELLYCIH